MNEKTMKPNITLTLHPPLGRHYLAPYKIVQQRREGVLEVDAELAIGREL